VMILRPAPGDASVITDEKAHRAFLTRRLHAAAGSATSSPSSWGGRRWVTTQPRGRHDARRDARHRRSLISSWLRRFSHSRTGLDGICVRGAWPNAIGEDEPEHSRRQTPTLPNCAEHAGPA
jgi:hypothetical protein